MKKYLNEIKGRLDYRYIFMALRVTAWIVLLSVAIHQHIDVRAFIALGGFLLTFDNFVKGKQAVYSVSNVRMEFLLEKLNKDLSGSIKNAVQEPDQNKRIDAFNKIVGNFKVLMAHVKQYVKGGTIWSE